MMTGRDQEVRFKKLIVCAGVWTDEVGALLEGAAWKPWIAPSRGLHLVFDWKRFPVPGAVTMQIEDGRIAFASPDNTAMGAEAKSGDSFELNHEPRPEWLKWNPSIPVGE
jgi:glycerol-3-phosphate dehydrogenase